MNRIRITSFLPVSPIQRIQKIHRNWKRKADDEEKKRKKLLTLHLKLFYQKKKREKKNKFFSLFYCMVYNNIETIPTITPNTNAAIQMYVGLIIP